MNPEPSQSSKLLNSKSKYLKRFNSKINTSLFDSNADTHHTSQHSHFYPSNFIREPQKSPLKHKPIIEKYLSHIAFLQNKLSDQEKMLSILAKENQQKSIQFDKLKKNFDILRQQNLNLENKHFQTESLNKTLNQELQMALKKLAISQIQYQDKLNQTENKLNQMQNLNQSIRTPFKRGRSRAKDMGVSSCSNIDTSPQQNPESTKLFGKSSKEIQNPSVNALSVQRINQILRSNSESQKKYVNLEISFQEKTNLCKKLQGQIDTIKQKLKDSQNKISESNQQNEKLRVKIEELTKKNQLQESLVKNAKQEAKNIELKYKALEEKFQQKEKQLTKCLVIANDKSIELEKVQHELYSIEQSHSITKKFYESEIQSLNQKITELALLIQEEPKKKALHENNQILKKNEIIEQLQEEKEKLEVLVKASHAKLDKKDKEIEQIRKLLEGLQLENEKNTKEKESLNRENHTLKHSLGQKQQQLKQIRQRQQALKETQLRQKLQENKDQQVIKELKEQLSKVQSQLSLQKENLNALRQEMMKIQKENEQKDAQIKVENVFFKERVLILEKQKQEVLKESEAAKISLQGFKQQCSEVVTKLTLDLQESATKVQQLTKVNISLKQSLGLAKSEIQTLKQQVQETKNQLQQAKRVFLEQKNILEQEYKGEINFLHQDKEKLIEQITNYREIQINEKEQEWKEKLETAQKQKLEHIELLEAKNQELEGKIKELEQKIEFMEEESNIKEQEVIALINQKNTHIKSKQIQLEEKSTLLLQKSQLLESLQKSLNSQS